MKRLSVKQEVSLFLLIFLIFLSLQEHNLLLFTKGIIALIAAVVFDTALYFIKSKKLTVTESSPITGLIIGFVLSSDLSWWIFVCAGFLAILSKHIIQIKGKHIFNPAAFAIILALAIFKGHSQWEGAYCWYIIIPLGLYFASKIKKLPIILAYYLTYLLISGAQSLVTKASFAGSLLYANYFFIFIMLVEPKTSPPGKKEGMVFGLAVGIISFALYSLNIPLDAELPALLIGNFMYSLYRQIIKKEVSYERKY